MFCREAKFLLKNDDDAVILIDRLMYWMKRYFELPSVADDRLIWTKELLEARAIAKPLPPTKKQIFGVLMRNKSVIRDETGKHQKW